MVELKPDYYWGQLDLALNYAALGRLDEARSAVAEARRLQPGLTFAIALAFVPTTPPELSERMAQTLREAGLE